MLRALGTNILTAILVCCFQTHAAADYLQGKLASEKGDFENAYALSLLSAQQGDPRSQERLGWLFETGTLVQKDYLEAAKWYEMSALKGYPEAQVA